MAFGVDPIHPVHQEIKHGFIFDFPHLSELNMNGFLMAVVYF